MVLLKLNHIKHLITLTSDKITQLSNVIYFKLEKLHFLLLYRKVYTGGHRNTRTFFISGFAYSRSKMDFFEEPILQC